MLKNSNIAIEPNVMEELKVAHNNRDYKTQSDIYPAVAQAYLRKGDYISAITIYNLALGACNKWLQSLLEKNHNYPCNASVFFNKRKKISCGINISEREYFNSIKIDFRLNRFPYEKIYHLHREYLTDLRRQVYEQLKLKKHFNNELC